MTEIPKAYEPQSVEDKWYDFWVKQGCFTADPARVSEKRPAYSIVIPPPNVTGMLHMGHVLNNTIQDILSRKARMDGKEVLWLPGTDHAGIATEGMVAKQLKKEEHKSKQDIGREEFIKRVWTWKEKHGGIIIQQLKKLGCSCDWTRERFTMDPDYVRNVQRVFVDLYKKGLIYRGKRMVNWCPATQTALSDEEVEMKPQKGFMYHFKVEVAESVGSAIVPVADSGVLPESSSIHSKSDERASGGTPGAATGTVALPGSDGKIWLTIATTRPETIPGDTAVAVNPKDPRYAHLIGKHIVRPLPAELPREQKLIPIIGDEHVDFEFGTGVLKVTPAHDKADFEIMTRAVRLACDGDGGGREVADMQPIEVIDAAGIMTHAAGERLAGLERFAARKTAVELLKELGVLVEEKPYENSVGFSQRADVPIEPRLSEQWFLKYPSVEVSKACVEQEGSARVSRADSGVAPESSSIHLKSEERTSGATPDAARGTRALPNKMRFHPDRWAKVYDHWLTNIQDWCISRQLWWGHRVPVWTKKIRGIQFRELCLGEDSTVYLTNDFNEWPKDGRNTTTLSLSAKLPDELQTNETLFVLRSDADNREHTIVSALTDCPAEAELLNRAGFIQDPDVLDTWCSSWLWPFATMGWPEQTETLKKFYPTTDLVTGPDIIFFWVARMIMAGYEYMGDLPFKNVYFTGIIRDKQGRKMSKTLGNSPDPLELIAKYGADALRFGTMRSAPLGQDVLFDEKDVELGRNFCNKLWNACRFRQMVGTVESGKVKVESQATDSAAPSTFNLQLSTSFEVQGEINAALLSSDDRWILLRLDQAIREVSDALATYNFATAVQSLYRFFWSEYCDWYVEASKAALGSARVPRADSGVAPESSFSISSERMDEQPPGATPDGAAGTAALPALRANKVAIIDFVLSHLLRMFHPLLPFITEELWHGMGYSADMPENQGGKTIMFAPWPKPLSDDEKDAWSLDDTVETFANAKFDLVTAGRNLKTQFNLGSSKKVKFVLKPAGELATNEVEVLRLLLNAESLEVNAAFAPQQTTPGTHTKLGELFLPLEGLIDHEAERARLTKELAKIQSEIEKVEQKLANPSFTQKVPPAVLEEHKQRLADWQAKLAQAKAALAALG